MRYILEHGNKRYVDLSRSMLINLLKWKFDFKPRREVVELIGAAPWLLKTPSGDVIVRAA